MVAGDAAVLRVSVAPGVTTPLRGTLRVQSSNGGATSCVNVETTTTASATSPLVVSFGTTRLGASRAPVFLGEAIGTVTQTVSLSIRNDSANTLALASSSLPASFVQVTPPPAQLTAGQQGTWVFSLPRPRVGRYVERLRLSYFVGTVPPSEPGSVRPRVDFDQAVAFGVYNAQSVGTYEVRVDGSVVPSTTSTIPLSFPTAVTKRTVAVRNASAYITLRVRLGARAPLLAGTPTGAIAPDPAEATPSSSVFALAPGQTLTTAFTLEDQHKLTFPFATSVDVQVFQ